MSETKENNKILRRAVTLVHKGAMEIGIHAVRTFAHHFSDTHVLIIHTDPSTDEEDHHLLLEAAKGMKVSIVSAKMRWDEIEAYLSGYPLTRQFLSRASYFAKLEVAMYEKCDYFFFDSDIVWLRHVSNLEPKNSPNAFSTETWSWYTGITNDKLWIKAKTPRRVNSGFHYIGETFPYDKMENMLVQSMFDRSIPFAGDQEIFAYLFHDMEYYHPLDFKRSRVASIYQLRDETCAALHFPGKMWLQHIDQILQLPYNINKPAIAVRYQAPVALSAIELFRMRVMVNISNWTVMAKPLNLLRKWRRAYR